MQATKIIMHDRKPWQYFLEGKEVTQEEFDAAVRPKDDVGVPMGVTPKGCRPKLSMVLGVHPDQVKEATEDAKRKGVPTEFAADGRAVIRSRAHQKAYLKAYHLRNNDAGYGD